MQDVDIIDRLRAVITDRSLTGAQRLALIAHMLHPGAGTSELAAMLGLSRFTVYRALRARPEIHVAPVQHSGGHDVAPVQHDVAVVQHPDGYDVAPVQQNVAPVQHDVAPVQHQILPNKKVSPTPPSKNIISRDLDSLSNTGNIRNVSIVDSEKNHSTLKLRRESKSLPRAKIARGVSDSPVTTTWLVWRAYADAYRERYGAEPPHSAKTNSICKQLVARVGEDTAIELARWYVRAAGYYARALHPLTLLLRDAETLAAQMRAWPAGLPEERHIRLAEDAPITMPAEEFWRQCVAEHMASLRKERGS